MASKIGTVLPRKPIAWFWLAVFGLPALYTAWGAFSGANSYAWPIILGVTAAIISVEPWIVNPEKETVQVDENGVNRVAGAIHEEIRWREITEIRILTTNEGPFHEDVFFLLKGANDKGCLIPHDAAVRAELLEELQSRFPGLDDRTVIEAMGCTDNNSFLIWPKHSAD